jgi:hypothetical protein
MTTRHLVIGLMQAMRTETHMQCEVKLGLPGGTFSHLYHGRSRSFTVMLLDRIQRRSGVSFDQLMAWFRAGEEVVMELPPRRARTRSKKGAGVAGLYDPSRLDDVYPPR